MGRFVIRLICSSFIRVFWFKNSSLDPFGRNCFCSYFSTFTSFLFHFSLLIIACLLTSI
jgi:hypothetical protein